MEIPGNSFTDFAKLFQYAVRRARLYSREPVFPSGVYSSGAKMNASSGTSLLAFAAAVSAVTAFIKRRSHTSKKAGVTLHEAISACATAASDADRVVEKLNRIVIGGLENLVSLRENHVCLSFKADCLSITCSGRGFACSLSSRLQALVMDFDRTISSFRGPNGGRGVTCHGTLEVGQSTETRARAQAFNDYYYPIEVDPKRTQEEKLPLMVEWYRSINNLFVEVGFKRKQLSAAVAGANLQLRPGATDIMDFCAATGVPLVIFSAGVGDVIKEVLRQKWSGCAAAGGKLPRNFRVFSNWMRFAAPDSAEAAEAAAPAPSTAPPGSSPVAEAAPLEQAVSTGPSSKDGDAVLVGWSDVIHMFNKHEVCYSSICLYRREAICGQELSSAVVSGCRDASWYRPASKRFRLPAAPMAALFVCLSSLLTALLSIASLRFLSFTHPAP